MLVAHTICRPSAVLALVQHPSVEPTLERRTWAGIRKSEQYILLTAELSRLTDYIISGAARHFLLTRRIDLLLDSSAGLICSTHWILVPGFRCHNHCMKTNAGMGDI